MIIIVSVLLVIGLVFGLVGISRYKAKDKYERAKQKLEAELANGFVVKNINGDVFDEIGGKWVCKNTEIGGPHSQAMKITGMAPTVANLIRLYNYRMPEYSWLDTGQNAKSLSIAKVQATIVPLSVDQAIHVTNDKSLAIIYHRDGMAWVFRETEEGFKEELWLREGKVIEEDANCLETDRKALTAE